MVKHLSGEIVSGILQGSVLGPLLPDGINSLCKKFADNTSVNQQVNVMITLKR